MPRTNHRRAGKEEGFRLGLVARAVRQGRLFEGRMAGRRCDVCGFSGTSSVVQGAFGAGWNAHLCCGCSGLVEAEAGRRRDPAPDGVAGMVRVTLPVNRRGRS